MKKIAEKKGAVICELGKPNANHRIYSEVEVAAALERAKPRFDRPGGGYGRFGNPTEEECLRNPGAIPLDLVSHQVVNMRIENGQWLADIHILDTPYGRHLALLEQKTEIAYRPVSIACFESVDVGGGKTAQRVTGIELISINAIPAELAA